MLSDKINRYQQMLDEHKALGELDKTMKAQLEEMEREILAEMVEEDVPSIEVGKHRYTVKSSTKWNKLSDEALMSRGINYLDLLRQNGLGDIIVERVNQQTLNSALNQAAEANNGELPGNLSDAFQPYEKVSISVTKTYRK